MTCKPVFKRISREMAEAYAQDAYLAKRITIQEARRAAWETHQRAMAREAASEIGLPAFVFFHLGDGQ